MVTESKHLGQQESIPIQFFVHGYSSKRVGCVWLYRLSGRLRDVSTCGTIALAYRDERHVLLYS